jgi:hypothetical protein
MFDTYSLSILSHFFHPFLQQERDRKVWIKKQVRMLMKNIDYIQSVLRADLVAVAARDNSRRLNC